MPARACSCDKPSHARSIGRKSASSMAEKTQSSAGEVLKEELRQAQDGIPRFLFRCWNNDPTSPSGGYQGLNTERAVTPLAYLNNDVVTSIFEQSEHALCYMLYNHLTVRHPTENEPQTQFSSWASSISVPFAFIHGRPNCYVAVLDTKHLRERGTFAAHVPALKFLDPDCVTYNWEYLVHGPVSGMLYQTLPASKFNAIGFPERYKWGAEPLLTGEFARSCGVLESRMQGKEHIDDALAVAKGYSTRFTTPVFLAIMTQKAKQPCLRADAVRHRELVEKIVAHVGRCRLRVPIDWCAERAIMQHGVVNTRGYPEVEAMLMCMRVLVLERYPKECAKKWPGLSREKVLGVEVEEAVRETREWVENWDAESSGGRGIWRMEKRWEEVGGILGEEIGVVANGRSKGVWHVKVLTVMDGEMRKPWPGKVTKAESTRSQEVGQERTWWMRNVTQCSASKVDGEADFQGVAEARGNQASSVDFGGLSSETDVSMHFNETISAFNATVGGADFSDFH